MKLLFVITVLCLSSKVYSQFQYLGHTIEEVKEIATREYPKVKFESSYEDGNTFIGWETKYWRETACFKKGLSCVFTLSVSNDVAVTALIKSFNKKYIQIQSDQWKAYLNGKVYKIAQVYVAETKSYIFMFAEF